MKRKQWIRTAVLLAICLMFAGLTACESVGGSEAERLWKTARKEDSFEEFIMGNASKIDTEALRQEAGAEDSTLGQRFKATAILCAMEYLQSGGGAWKNGALSAGYPESAGYALDFLGQIHTAGADFWAAFEDAFYPYDCFLPLLAAAKGLDGETFLKLWAEVPEDSRYAEEWLETIDSWVKANPCLLATMGEALADGGYYEDWDLSDWRETYLHNAVRPYAVQTATVEEALAYIANVQTIVLDGQEKTFGADYFKEESPILGELCYATDLTVTIDEELKLKDGGREQEEPIETEGKKVAVFYRNLQSAKFEGSPSPLRLLGDFMLQLSESERPLSVSEADYYLVLTARYQYGDYYQTSRGEESKIREVYSSTSVDLYDAKEKTLIRHLGTMPELAPDTVTASYGEESLCYPETPSGDALLFIYRHINEPEAYRALMDQTLGRSELELGETAVVGSWEITYHDSEIVPEFDTSLSHFEAESGSQFVRSRFTITNAGFEEEEFLSRIGVYTGGREVYVQLVDARKEEAYTPKDMIMNYACLNGSYLEPQETKEGELIFEIPQEAAQRTQDLYLVVFFGNEEVYYPLE